MNCSVCTGIKVEKEKAGTKMKEEAGIRKSLLSEAPKGGLVTGLS